MFDDLKRHIRVAPWWERLAARLLGERFENRDGDTVAVGYYWRRDELDTKIIKRIRGLLDHSDKSVRSAAEIWAVEHSGLDAALTEVERQRSRLDGIETALKARGLFAFEHVDGTFTINDR